MPKEVTRPSTDFVRQALFSILSERVDGARILDLFAGSGALGLEALSRGATSCVFVDSNRKAEKVLQENLNTCQLKGGRVVKADVHAWVRRDMGEYDLIFADPPYMRTLLDHDHLGELINKDGLVDRLSEDGIIIFEQSADAEVRDFAGLDLMLNRSYGGSAILLYARKSAS